MKTLRTRFYHLNNIITLCNHQSKNSKKNGAFRLRLPSRWPLVLPALLGEALHVLGHGDGLEAPAILDRVPRAAGVGAGRAIAGGAQFRQAGLRERHVGVLEAQRSGSNRQRTLEVLAGLRQIALGLLPENTELSQSIYKALKAQGLIDSRVIEQFFDPDKGMFLPDRFIKGECPKCGSADQYGDNCEVCGAVYQPTELKHPYSALSGATPVLRTSEHFFFKLSDPRCVEFLEAWTQDGRLQPEVANKVKEWFTRDADGKVNLGDWDISRDAPYFGIEIPDAPGKYFYVWLDAPIGYLASLKALLDARGVDIDAYLADPEREQVHFIGKDIVTFHTLFWPAMLRFSGRKIPDRVHVHGFLTVKGDKLSKSRGTGISPLRYLELGLNPEWLRYYLCAKLSARVEDIDFNAEDFVARVNSDLVGKYINIASRAAGFLSKRFGGRLSADVGVEGRVLLDGLRAHAGAVATLYEEREYGKALREVMAAADQVNTAFDAAAPWRLAKAGQGLYDPFTGLPMLVNMKKGVLYSVGPDLKDNEAHERLDLVAQIPSVAWAGGKKAADAGKAK